MDAFVSIDCQNIINQYNFFIYDIIYTGSYETLFLPNAVTQWSFLHRQSSRVSTTEVHTSKLEDGNAFLTLMPIRSPTHISKVFSAEWVRPEARRLTPAPE